MKHTGRYLALVMAVIIAVAIFVIPAAADNTATYSFEPNSALDLDASNISSASTVCSLKFDIPESGKISFTSGGRKLSKKSVYKIVTEEGKSVISGKVSELPGKTFTVNKAGSYSLNITLRKGQYIKKLAYSFVTLSSLDATPEGWLYNYTLADDDIAQLNKAFAAFVWHDGMRFDDGRIDEAAAIDWLYDPNGWICDPYNSEVGSRYQGAVIAEDVLKKFGSKRIPYVECVPAGDLDKIVYHLFGITPQHGTNGENWYFHDGDYYFNGVVSKNKSSISCKQYKVLPDGRTEVTMSYHRYTGEDENGEAAYSDSELYAVVSVHKTGSRNYVRIHSVYDADETEMVTAVLS